MSNFMKSGYFTVTPQVLAQDDRLSWKARGIFLYLASMPDGWDFYMDEIVKHSPGGKRALTSGIRELENYGYLTREMQHGEHGKFGNMIWVLHTEPTERPEKPKETPKEKVEVPERPANQHSHRQIQNSVNGKTPSTAKCVQRKTRLTHNAPLQKNHSIKEPVQKNNQNNLLSSSANDDATPAEQTELLSSQPKKPTANLSQRDQTKATSDKQELYQAVIDYLNQYTGKHYRSTTKATQRLINGRVKEGATLADFKHVITVKCRQWQGTSMQQYLRPSTLFSPQHFEEYAQEPLQDLPVKNGRKVIEKLPEWAQQPAATQPSVQAASTNDKDKARLAKERKALLAQLRPAQ